MGLRVSVYRNAEFDENHTNFGVTGRFKSLTVVNIEGPFEPTLESPGVKLVRGAMSGIARIVPIEVEHRCTQMGGNYAATSDSRFSEAVEKIVGTRFYGAVPVHDRVESRVMGECLCDVISYFQKIGVNASDEDIAQYMEWGAARTLIKSGVRDKRFRRTETGLVVDRPFDPRIRIDP
jgi:hypothetical protein